MVNMLYDHRPAFLVTPGTVLWELFSHVAFTRLKEKADNADFLANPTPERRKKLLAQLFPQIATIEQRQEEERKKFMEDWTETKPFYVAPPEEMVNSGPQVPKGRVPERLR